MFAPMFAKAQIKAAGASASSGAPPQSMLAGKNGCRSDEPVPERQRVIGNLETPTHGFDFSRVSIWPRARSAASLSSGGQTAEEAGMVLGRDPATHDFGTLRICAVPPPAARGTSLIDIPAVGEPTAEIVDQPLGGSGTAAAPTPTDTESCDQPRSMDKVTSGQFLGGLTMDSYYPDLTGGGTYNHPGTGGTFDTGSRAGANIQLYGVIPSPCLPQTFQLAQTVTRTRYRINGVIHPQEGRTFDDLAKSGRDTTRPPFRQDFLGGGAAPLGYIISMADPPSTGYGAASNIEHDRDFVTSLVGPGGSKSVTWSLSTRISGGSVTTNVLS